MDFEEVVRKSTDKSSVWHYFLRSKNKNQAKCKRCQNILKSAGGSTSSLRHHLHKIHNINLAKRTNSDDGASTSHLESREVSGKKTRKNVNPSMQLMVSRMVSLDGLALRTFVKSQDLRYVFENMGYKLPKTADTIQKIIFKEYDQRKLEVRNEIKDILLDGKKFSMSFDEWTSNHNRRFIALTLHSPNFSGSSAFRNMGLIRIHGSMNAEKCVNLIESKLNEYGVSLSQDIVAQTTDGCSLMVAFGKRLESYHQLCIAHSVQLAIVDVLYKRNSAFIELTDEETPQIEKESEYDENLTLAELAFRMCTGEINDEIDDDNTLENYEDDGAEFNNEALDMDMNRPSFKYQDLIAKVRKVVKMFKKSPTKNDEILQKHVISDFGQEYSLLLDGKTRWSSMAIMLDRFLKLKISITKALIDIKSDITFTESDWTNLTQLHNILDIIKAVVVALCRRDATLLTADVAIKFAITKLIEMNTQLSNEMLAALLKRYKKRRLVQAAILKYLTNPKKYFEGVNDETFPRPTCEKMLNEIVSLIMRTSSKDNLSYERLTASQTECQENVNSEILTNEEQLNQELNEAITEATVIESNDLKTTIRVEMALYENGGQRGHYLSLAFEHIKTISPTSVEPERIFSSAGIICNRLRSSLSDKTLDAIIFLRSFYRTVM